MKNPRINVHEAVRLANEAGIPVRRQKDGHYLFWIGLNRVVSVNHGRNAEVPPRLAVALRRAKENRIGNEA